MVHCLIQLVYVLGRGLLGNPYGYVQGGFLVKNAPIATSTSARHSDHPTPTYNTTNATKSTSKEPNMPDEGKPSSKGKLSEQN